MDVEDDVLSDENLEGDCGSDFGDGDFPSEWTVLDDADEEGDVEEMTVVEEVGEEDEEAVVEEKTKTPEKKTSEKITPEKKTPEKKPAEKKPAGKKRSESKSTDKKSSSSDNSRSEGTKDNPIEIDDSKSKDKDDKPGPKSKPASKPVEKKPPPEKKKQVEDDLESIEGDMGDEDMETEVTKRDTRSSRKQSPARSSQRKDTPKTTPDTKKTSQPSKSTSSASKSTTPKKEEPKANTSTSDSSKTPPASVKETSSSAKKEATSEKKDATSEKKEATSEKKEATSEKKEITSEKKETGTVKKESQSEKKDSSSSAKESSSKKEKPQDKKESAVKKETAAAKKETESIQKDKRDDAGKKTSENGKPESSSEATKTKDQPKEKLKEALTEYLSSNAAKLICDRSNELTAKLKLVLGDLEVKEMEPLEKSWDSTPKWHLKVQPIDTKDMALDGLKKVINISQSAAYFLVGRANRNEGYMSFLFNHYKDVQLVVNKLSCISFTSKNITISLIRKKGRKGTEIETAEMIVVSNSAANLTMPIRGKEWIGEGKLKNRQLNINNVPVGTSKEMLEVMFPYTLSVKFQTLKGKEKSGIATLECSSTAMARSVKKCYVSIRIGKENVELSRVIEDKDEKDEKPAGNVQQNSGTSNPKDSPRQRDRSRETSSHSNRDNNKRNNNDNRNGNVSRTGRKVDAKVSVRQEQAKKIRDRSRQILTQNRPGPNRPAPNRPVPNRPVPNRPAPVDIRRKQEQAMQQIQQRQMQIQQQQQQMQMQKKMMMQQQMAQAVQQNQMALASFQTQSQAKMAMMEGSGDGLLGPAPMMGRQNSNQQQGGMEPAAVPSHIQMMPGMNVNIMAQQEKERMQRRQLAGMENMDGMARGNMGQAQNQYAQRMEAERAEMLRQEEKLANRIEPGFSQQQMNRNEGLLARREAMMGRSEPMHGRNEGGLVRNEPLLSREESLMNRNEQMAHHEPQLRSSESWAERSPRRSAPAINRMASRSPAGSQNIYEQGSAQLERRHSDQFQEEQEWGRDYPDAGITRKEVLVAERRRAEMERGGQEDWSQEYRAQDHRAQDHRAQDHRAQDHRAQDPYREDAYREESYSAGMKRPGQISRESEILEKRQRIDQRSEYPVREDNHQLQDMDWTKPDEMKEERRALRQRDYDEVTLQSRSQQPSWGSGSLMPEPEPESGFKIHDYGHQSQVDDLWEDNRQARWESGNGPALLPKPPAPPVGILRKSGAQHQGGQQQMRQGSQPQRQQQQRQQQQRQQQQRPQSQRQQNTGQQNPRQGMQRQQNQRQQQQRQQQSPSQAASGPVQRQQQAMMQHQMMQAAGRFQPKMVLLPTRLIPGMKRK